MSMKTYLLEERLRKMESRLDELEEKKVIVKKGRPAKTDKD